MTISAAIFVMLAAGVGGGIVNFALARTAESTWSDALSSIVIGLGAAFLIPLFLNTISSSLFPGLLNGSAAKADQFVFFGFCLLGAIASKTMIQTLTQKVLRTAEEAKRQVQELKKEVAPIIDKESEPPIDHDESGAKMEAYGLVGPDPGKIIQALGSSQYSRRTVQGIQKDTDVPQPKVIEILEWLRQNGLGSATGESGKYWGLTEKGRNVFANLIKNQSVGSSQ